MLLTPEFATPPAKLGWIDMMIDDVDVLAMRLCALAVHRLIQHHWPASADASTR
jgi:hypothetical protein